MSDEESKQPRKVKDLKARLGRTIAPNTPGAPAITPPPGAGGVVPPAGVAAPPAAAGSTPAEGAQAPAGGAAIPPPAIAPIAPGQPLPPLNLGPKPVVVPPMVQQQMEEEARRKKREASDDPFAATEHRGPQKVVLAIDDSKVHDHEVGRAGKNRGLIITVGIVAVIAIGVGYGLGAVMKDRQTHNAGIRAGRAIHEAVQHAGDPLTKVQQNVERAITAARGAPGRAPRVDYDALTALRAIENPFRADRFSRQRYDLFNATAVDALFSYYLKVNRLFELIDRTTAKNLSTRRRAELDEAASNAGNMMTDQTGCVPVLAQNRLWCNLVYVDAPQQGAQPSPMLRVRATKGAQAQEREIYAGQNLAENSDKYVILTNTQTSVGVLGQRAAAFAEYNRDLLELKALIDEVNETQGRFEQELDRIRSMQEVFTF